MGIEIDIPGYGTLGLEHVVMDYNGTLAVDGRIVPGVAEALGRIAESVTLHVITADTFGLAAAELSGVDCRLHVLETGGHRQAKRDFVEALGSGVTAAIGNGRNDSMMLKAAALGIVVLLEEGASVEAVTAADVLCPSIISALGLLERPMRLKATLRS